METRRLEYFVVLTAERSFSRAANRLNISQSALSQQIQRLERDIGGKLVDRSVVPFELTEVGQRLLVQSRSLLNEIQQIDALATDARSGKVGRIRIGMVPSLLYSQVPHMISRFRARNRSIDVQLERQSSKHLIDMLRLSQLDVAFLFTKPPVPDINHVELYKDPYLVVLPDDHSLAQTEGIELAQLRRETIMLSPRWGAPEAHDAILGACVDCGFSAHRMIIEGTTYTDQVGLVAAGLGVSLLPSRLARISVPGVAYVPLTTPALRSSVQLAWAPSASGLLRDRFVRYSHRFFNAGDEPVERRRLPGRHRSV